MRPTTARVSAGSAYSVPSLPTPDPLRIDSLLDKLFFGSRLHEHADPAQRVLGVSALAPDAPVLVQMLAADPSAEVRAAAAGRCDNPAALLAAMQAERDP